MRAVAMSAARCRPVCVDNGSDVADVADVADVSADAATVTATATAAPGGNCGPRPKAAMAVTRAWTAVISSPTSTPKAAPVTPQAAAKPMVKAVRVTASKT